MSNTQKIEDCKNALRSATTYREWRAIALELDHLEGHEEWKLNKESDDYNYKLIEKRLAQLRKHREENDIPQMIFHLREGLHRNHGNITNPKLYSQTHVGTKHLIEEYIREVAGLLDYLCDNEFEAFPFPEKIRFFDECSRSFGSSALLLSGGAMLGLFHIGVIKALDEHDLIPGVVSGSSVGAVMAGALGTFSNLKDLYDPEKLYLDIWSKLPLAEILKQGTIMDAAQMEFFLKKNVGEYLTLEEAFKITGKHLNVTVSPAIENHATKLLNHLNAPHLLVWSAIMASCAVPGIFPPVQLMAKDQQGNIVPYMADCKWNDGTLTSDLPMKRLAELYNVTHGIVSQVNPHVIPFISDKVTESGRMGGIKHVIMAEIKTIGKWMIRIVQYVIREKRITQGLDMLHDILDQKYMGDITIRMTPNLTNYANMIKNPSHEFFRNLVLEGERATWPKINMIYHQTQIGQTLEKCVKKLEQSRRFERRSRRTDNTDGTMLVIDSKSA
ncbi:MAG: DUF3336 domain-containing protein [SAR324 cluster bacterium]|nr:DUF3336 domain-containing protein [SAR324 cluster bacterium]